MYYSINDCLVTLQQLRYDSDLHSSETLRQATHRLPPCLMTKWAEYCLFIRRRAEEPNLEHLARWLQDRMLAQKERSAFSRKKTEERQKPPEKSKDEKITLLGMSKPVDNQPKQLKCPLCTSQHALWRCNKYKNMKPEKRYDSVKSLKLCFNCFDNGHMWPKCESSNKCLQKD